MTPEQEEQKAHLEEWISSRPEAVQAAIREKPPWNTYRMETGHIVTLYSYSEPQTEVGTTDQDREVTCTVLVLKENNPDLLFERKVFGITLDSLIQVPDGTVSKGKL